MKTVVRVMMVVVMCWAGCAWGETVRVAVVVKDEGRKKDIEVTVVYPKVGKVEGEKWPVVVVSHAQGESGASMGEWMAMIAEGGFVVVAPTHEDSRAIGGVDRPLLKGGAVLWEGRARDVSAVIGADWGKLVPALSGKVSGEKVAVVGQGLGAYTAMLVGGVRPEWEKKERDLRDDRVRVVVLLSAPGVGNFGLTEKSFGYLGAAALVIRSENLDGSKRKEGVFELSPEGGKFMMTVQKGSPPALGRFGWVGTFAEGPMRAMTAVTLAFLRAELKGDVEAKDELVAGSVMAGFRDVGTLEGR